MRLAVPRQIQPVPHALGRRAIPADELGRLCVAGRPVREFHSLSGDRRDDCAGSVIVASETRNMAGVVLEAGIPCFGYWGSASARISASGAAEPVRHDCHTQVLGCRGG